MLRAYICTHAHTHTCIYIYVYHTGAYGEWPGPGAEKTHIPKTHLYNQATGTNESLSKMFLPFSLCSPSHSPFPVFSLTLTFSLSHSLSLSLARCLPPSLTPSLWVVLMRACICCFSPPLSQNRSLFLVVLLFHTHSRSLYLTCVLVSTFLCTLFFAWQGSFRCVAWTTLTLSWLCDSVLSHLFMHESCHTYE